MGVTHVEPSSGDRTRTCDPVINSHSSAPLDTRGTGDRTGQDAPSRARNGHASVPVSVPVRRATSRCRVCRKVRHLKSGRRFASDLCWRCDPRHAHKTKDRARPRGGRYVDHRGYVRVTIEATRTGRRYEHRVVAEQALGRPLRRTEVVHHVNGNKQDNRPENLRVMSRSAHIALHNRQEPKRRRVTREVA